MVDGIAGRLAIVFSAEHGHGSVSDVCRALGISRQSYYKWLGRYRAEGVAGLVERSRRPARSPRETSAELEDEIVRLRKTLMGDRGAQSIVNALERSGWAAPSRATVHRVLVRRGQVTPQPAKRPRSAGWKRFVWPRPNDLWQIDATRFVLSDRRELWIMDVLDDHSRVSVAARVCTGPTGQAAWGALCDGAEKWGLPARVLSDNGACFTSRLRHDVGEAQFTRELRTLGIAQLLSSPGHPQTCGKIERFHQTMHRWLGDWIDRHGPIVDARALQQAIDEFRSFYNYERGHRALQRRTPAETWAASPPATPGTPTAGHPDAILAIVNANGTLAWHGRRLGVGMAFAGQQLLLIGHGDTVEVFTPDRLVRRFTIDPTRQYQRAHPRSASGPRH